MIIANYIGIGVFLNFIAWMIVTCEIAAIRIYFYRQGTPLAIYMTPEAEIKRATKFQEGKMETIIYMIRHAESPFVFGQERTRGLSEQGKLDAQKITELMVDEPIDYIVSSPYTRAIQTVQGLADFRNLPIKEYEELKERAVKCLDYKISEKELFEEVKKSFEDQEYCLPGGESIKQAQDRAVPIIKHLMREYEGKRIVIGTHGNIMTIIMNHFDDRYGYDFWKSTSKPDIYKLIFNSDRLTKIERMWS